MDYHGKILKYGAWDIRNKNKFSSHFDKALFIKDDMVSMKVQYNIDKIFIEQPFSFFSSGGSSAKTMATLQRFNGIVSWLCFDIFSITPRYLTAQEARKLCEIKVPRGEKAKKIVLGWVTKNVKGFKVEYTSRHNPKPKYYDIADSLVVAMAGYYMCGGDSSEKT